MKKENSARRIHPAREKVSYVPSGGETGPREACAGIVVGKVVAMSGDFQPVVSFGNFPDRRPMVCRSVVDVDEQSLGREVVVQFENGDTSRPIIMGILRAPAVAGQDVEAPSGGTAKRRIEVDGERILLAGEREITLQCGEARITLTKAGKILIHGNYVLTRSRGACKLKGATVDIN